MLGRLVDYVETGPKKLARFLKSMTDNAPSEEFLWIPKLLVRQSVVHLFQTQSQYLQILQKPGTQLSELSLGNSSS